MKSKFIEISKKYNGDYKVTDFKVDGTLGSKLPITIHSLNLAYNQTDLKITYELGNSNIAEVKFEIEVEQKVPNFELNTRDHFSRLFRFNKSPWNLKSKDQFILSKIVDYLHVTGLTEMANKESFEPVIHGNYADGKYNFNTKFYLGFTNNETSLSPIIEFHKKVIDLLKGKSCS